VTTDTTTLARRQLGVRLRRLQEAARKTMADVETAGIGSPSKIWRIESGRSSVRSGDVRELCVLYDAPDEALDPLLALARATKGEGWWEDWNDVLMVGFGLYLDLEATATAIYTYDAELIHGLLQTPEYHRAITVAKSVAAKAEMRRFEELRQERIRAVLDREAPCRLTAVIGEAALRRIIGSPDIMAGQLEHLRELVGLRNVQIRVLTWMAGAHAGLRGGAFTLMDFDDPEDPNIVYLESHTSARYLEQKTELRKYRDVWTILTRQSVPIEEYTP
jgi:transcriptional regulator with XRE-family HTH domain